MSIASGAEDDRGDRDLGLGRAIDDGPAAAEKIVVDILLRHRHVRLPRDGEEKIDEVRIDVISIEVDDEEGTMTRLENEIEAASTIEGDDTLRAASMR